MKTVIEFLFDLKSLNVKLWTKDNQLHCSAPEGLLTEVLRTELAERKTEIIAFLQKTSAVKLPNIRPILTASRDRDLPLSFNQQRLWLVEQIESDSSAYNMPAAFRLKGFLEVASLEHSLNEIIKRHEVLRTIFSNINGQPSQVICSEVNLKLPVVDLQKLPKKQQEEEAQQLLIEEARLLFDLDRWPLLRCKLLRLDKKEHLLLLTAHHIVFDGWSFNIFCQELATLYEAFTTRKSLPLPELTIQYVDFAIWQREWLKDDILKVQMNYWKQQLEGSTPLLQLPTDQLRSSVQTHRGACQSLLLSKNLTETLKTLSHQEEATLFMTLLAAFKVLLHRYTDQEDILVGSPIAGRNRKELEGLIGFFVNTLVLRTSVSSHISFRELLSRVREVTLGAYVHQDIPLEKLLEELKLKRDLNHNPLFRVWFNMENVVDTSLELPGLTVETISSLETSAKFDLNLYVREQKQGIELKLVYNADLFGAARMMEMLKQFEYLLQQIVSAPEKTIRSYSLLTPQSRPLLPDPSAALPEPEHEPITNLFTSWAARTPKQIAISQGDCTWTYDELAESARAIAQILIAKGIERGDVVAVSGSKSFGLITGMLGALLSGGVLLTLAHNFPRQRQQLMLEQAEAHHLLYVGQLPKEKKWIEEFIEISFIDPETGNTRIPDSLPLNSYTLEPLNPDDAAYVFFTSGTTGIPKGVLGSHKGLSHFLNWQGQKFSVSPQDRLAQLTGLSFDVVLRDIFLPLTSGATLCLPEVEDDLTPAYILPWLEREQISLLHTVPTLAQSWLTDMSPAVSLRKLRWVFFAGEPLTETLVRRWRKAFPESGKIVNLYGPTETTLAKCCYEISDNVLLGVQPIGLSLPNSQALVLGENGQMCGIGEIGEIVLRTPFRSLGYINASQENQRRFVKNHFSNEEEDLLYYTGDLGRYRPDGTLEILGRLDHQIKLRGVRIELEEIEAILNQYSAVQDCRVIAHEDESGDKRLVAYYVSSEPERQTSSATELRKFLQQTLPKYMVPSVFKPLESLPLTSNGKLDQKALPAPSYSRDNLKNIFIAPQNSTEQTIADLWSDVFKVNNIGIHDNFFELGGHSLLAIQVISRLQTSLSIELSLESLFKFPTVVDLAKHIETTHQIVQIAQTDNLTAYPRTINPVSRSKKKSNYFPLSIAQQQRFFLYQLESNHKFLQQSDQNSSFSQYATLGAAYSKLGSFKACYLSGELDSNVLEQSLNALVERHESLRTTFIFKDNQIFQRVVTKLIVYIPIVNLSNLSQLEREAESKRLIEQEDCEPFDLSIGPLLRTKLLKLSKTEYIFLLNLHHIIMDGRSLEILVRELELFYKSLIKNHSLPSISPLPIQYGDFASWQQDHIQGQVLKNLYSYWEERLSGVAQPLNFPTDYPRTATSKFRAADQSIKLSRNLVGNLRALSTRLGVTLFMLLLVALKVSIHFYTENPETFITVPIEGRNHIETRDLIGLFASGVVLRANLSGDPTFNELSRQVRQVVLGAFEHHSLPYIKQMEILLNEHKLSSLPLVPVSFNYIQHLIFPQKFLGLKSKILNFDYEPRAGTDISLILLDEGKEIYGRLTYNHNLFCSTTVTKLLNCWQTILENVVINSNRKLSELKKFN